MPEWRKRKQHNQYSLINPEVYSFILILAIEKYHATSWQILIPIRQNNASSEQFKDIRNIRLLSALRRSVWEARQRELPH